MLDYPDNLTERRRTRLRQTAQQRQRGLMVVMENVHNQHNLAAIARSCDAFGVQSLAFTVEQAELFGLREETKFTSSSASKWLDYRIFEGGTETCLTTLQAEGWHIAATVADTDAPSLYDFDWTRYPKLAVLVGNEKEGLSPSALRLADVRMTIPMRGLIQSLNVSVAAAITLAEVVRQRDASPQDFHLSPTEAEQLYQTLVQRHLEAERPS